MIRLIYHKNTFETEEEENVRRSKLIFPFKLIAVYVCLDRGTKIARKYYNVNTIIFFFIDFFYFDKLLEMCTNRHNFGF